MEREILSHPARGIQEHCHIKTTQQNLPPMPENSPGEHLGGQPVPAMRGTPWHWGSATPDPDKPALQQRSLCQSHAPAWVV